MALERPSKYPPKSHLLFLLNTTTSAFFDRHQSNLLSLQTKATFFFISTSFYFHHGWDMGTLQRGTRGQAAANEDNDGKYKQRKAKYESQAR